MNKPDGPFSLNKISHTRLKQAYRKIYGKKYDGTGERFAAYGNVRVDSGRVTQVTFLNKEEMMIMQRAIKKAEDRIKTKMATSKTTVAMTERKVTTTRKASVKV